MATKLINGILFRGQDLTGKKFGRLTCVGLDRISRVAPPAHGTKIFWMCVCMCGNPCVVYAGNLRLGTARSCGCLQRDSVTERCLTHGDSRGKKEKIYRVWQSMRDRCNRKSCKGYKNYGGRGIKLSEEWNDYANFKKDMADSFRPGLTIERSDNDGPYSKGNCRWATMKEQGRNNRRNRVVEFLGETKCISAWAEAHGLKPGTIYRRLNCGWPVERSLKTPAQRIRSATNKIE